MERDVRAAVEEIRLANKLGAFDTDGVPPSSDTTDTVTCGCGAKIVVTKRSVPLDPPAAMLVRKLRDGSATWYCGYSCYQEQQSRA
jgi:hypothetical protein